eukprot:GFYU01025142.1.p2 GENE.GFYU01025142.1~~GFYU01025142.1.p2  ORF type:complete len:171 (-),score=34.96 GFYU01025142.1:256-768(-)
MTMSGVEAGDDDLPPLPQLVSYQVRDVLLLGWEPAIDELRELRTKHDVGLLISLAESFSMVQSACEKLHLDHLAISWKHQMAPTLAQIDQFTTAVDVYSNKGKTVAVYGLNNSGCAETALGCYLVYKGNMNHAQAVTEMKGVNPKAFSSQDQEKFVEKYEWSVKGHDNVI